jgi:hypothetical protein
MIATAALKRQAPRPPSLVIDRARGRSVASALPFSKNVRSALPNVTPDHANEPPLPASQEACLVRAHRSQLDRSSASLKSP